MPDRFASVSAKITAIWAFMKEVSPLRWPRKWFDAMMEPKDGDSRNALFVFMLVALALMAAVFVIGVAASSKDVQFGAFGDFFGGVVNPILSFLTFVGLLITIVMQQKEIRLSRAHAEKLAFETLFFQMVTIHETIVSGMDLRTDQGDEGSAKEWHARDCFPRFYAHLGSEYQGAIGRHSENPIDEAYDLFWRRDQKDLGHYFRYLYNMIRIVDESGADTTRYMKLLRAQLSDHELLILFYNGLNKRGQKFKPYIEKYAIFDNLPYELLLDPSHLELYSGSARSDAQAKVARQSPRDFLKWWVQNYISAESRDSSDIDGTIEEIVEDAKQSGISRSQLERAATGSLQMYLMRAIINRLG